MTYGCHRAIKGSTVKEQWERTNLDGSQETAARKRRPATSCLWWSRLCSPDCRCLVHTSDQALLVDYTTSQLEYSSVIMTLHDGTSIRSDSPADRYTSVCCSRRQPQEVVPSKQISDNGKHLYARVMSRPSIMWACTQRMQFNTVLKIFLLNKGQKQRGRDTKKIYIYIIATTR